VETGYEINRPQVIAEVVDDEVVAINLDSGCYYNLRDFGALIWLGVEGYGSAARIAAAFADRCGADREEVEDAVAGFLAELQREGLIRPSANGASGDGAAALHSISPRIAADGPGRFEPPSLEKFTDLEDLLLLDPVHDVDGQGWPHPAPGS
jgi:hypothetical protein